MQVFFKVLNGDTLTVDIDQDATWAKVKEQIAHMTGIDASDQKMIFCGKWVNDSRRPILDDKAHMAPHVDLVPRLKKTKINFSDYNLYVIVHNFYGEDGEDVEHSKLLSFQHAVQIRSNEESEEINALFEHMYGVRQQRIEKNKNNAATPIFALIGVKKSANVTLYESTLMSSDDNQLPYEIFSYILPDGTPVMAPTLHAEEKIRELNLAFRLFCAKKHQEYQIQKNQELHDKEDELEELRFHENPSINESIEEIENEEDHEFGEVRAYLEMTEEYVFEGKSPQEIQQILQELKRVAIMGEVANEEHPLYASVNELNIVQMANSFQIVQTKVDNDTNEEEIKEIMQNMLIKAIASWEQKYLSVAGSNNKSSPLATHFFVQRKEKSAMFSQEQLANYIDMKRKEESKHWRPYKFFAGIFSPRKCGAEKLRVAEKMLEGLKNGNTNDLLNDNEIKTCTSGRFLTYGNGSRDE